MILRFSSRVGARRKFPRAVRGTTLVEMLLTMGIFGFVVAGILAAFIFGLHQDQLVQSKLGASDESRRSFEKVARDIRSANSQQVGNYDSSLGVFTPCINGTNMVGNAIRIYLLAANDGNPGNVNIIYYFNTNGASGTWTLNRIHTGDTAPTVIASHLQNSGTFTEEAYDGTPRTAVFDRNVIHFMLDFCEYQYPLTKVGTNGCYYDRYVMDFRATPHVPGGR
jgi:type II secretory pathway pseudopilin PulG